MAVGIEGVKYISETIGGEKTNAVCRVFWKESRGMEWLSGVKGVRK